MALFDRYIMVDWSANNSPKLGKDSIWVADMKRSPTGFGEIKTSNPKTRYIAMNGVKSAIKESIENNHKVLIGFDFAFGYPIDFARKLGCDLGYRNFWSKLTEGLTDNDRNNSNRFEIAAKLNKKYLSNTPMFWGHPKGRSYDGLLATKPRSNSQIMEMRHTDKIAKHVQPVWKMAYPGSVGSQTLLGIHHLSTMMQDDEIAKNISVWPFESGFKLDYSKLCTIVEIYPSMCLFDGRYDDDEIKDSRQVKSACDTFFELDSCNQLSKLFAKPECVDAESETDVTCGEGWIFGLERNPVKRRLAPSIGAITLNLGSYIRDPDAIYAKSFATIRAEAGLERFSVSIAHVAERVIHACGMVDVVDDLQFSPDAAEAGRAALLKGATILCDAEMVRQGIIQRLLPSQNELVCLIGEERVALQAKAISNTLSAAQVDFWAEHLGGAIVAIGNAPTALFHLLELIDQGAPKPALILGFPVGFVGAAESKLELASNPRGVPFITVRERRGGSAMAAAAVNALSTGWQS